MRPRQMKKIVVVLPLLILLSSCAEMNTQFDCPMTSGIRCESIDSVNSRVDHGDMGRLSTSSASDKNRQAMPVYKNVLPVTPKYSAKNAPPRSRETVQHVWVAPFEDKEGNYHQESDIYTVTKPGSWVGAPLKETNDDGE